MANSVHLVRQQADVLASNLSVSPAVLCGHDKQDTWRQKDYWNSLLQENLPIVCTPAILQQCLDGALLGMDQISLLIFDEAHHAKKNHPYSRIMRSHYMKCTPDRRPQIFGMTASPIDSKGSVDASVADLEHLLQSKITTTSDMSIMSFAPRPQDVIWQYPRSQMVQRTELNQTLQSRCVSQEVIQRGLVFADYAHAELGPWCADQAWKYIFNLSEVGLATMTKQYEASKTYINMESTKQRELELEKLKDAHTLIRQTVHQSVYPDTNLLSPKVLRLQAELSQRYASDPTIRGIVFVDQRLAALTLYDCFTRLKLTNLRPGVLLGNSSESSVPQDHRQTMEHFRAGLINLIFATSVADEGIDIPQCNLCIRFDLYKTPIQYMQSRGRARMTGSIYVHMIEYDNLSQKHAVQYAIDSDTYIKDFCQSLPTDRLLGHGTRLERLIAQDASNKTFETTAGVICDFGNSLLVLSKFATSLQYIGALEREIYEEFIDDELHLFRYIVRLPAVTTTQVKGARGQWRPNKQLAKRSAAFNCCFMLRQKGLLDDQLQSVYRKVKPENHNARLATSEKKSAYSMCIKPALWSIDIGTVPKKVFAYVVSFDPKTELRHPPQPIVMLTRQCLPDFPIFNVFLEENVETVVSIRQMDGVLQVTTADIHLLTIFTLDGVFLDVFNKHYAHDPSKMSYWLAPIASSPKTNAGKLADVVDIEAMDRIRAGRMKWTLETNHSSCWSDRFICDPRNGKFRYFSQGGAAGVKPFDPVADWVPAIPQKSRQSIIDFSDSYWKASKKQFAAATWNPDQLVLNADLVSARRNFLEPMSDEQCMYTKCLIAPQPLEVSRLASGFAAACLIWPAILHRTEAYMIASSGAESIGLRGIPVDLALEAFTKDTNPDDANVQNHWDGLTGMGKNYERLEFLGDSLLKMMTTITVFLRTNCDEEGMHCRRMDILCNRRLYEVSTNKHQLYQYVRTTGFNRDTWYPEQLTLIKGRGAKIPPEPVHHAEVTQDLSMKTIADVSEALIGAAVMATQYLPCRFDLAIQAITLLVDSPDHAIETWSDILPMYKPPLWSVVPNDIVANHLAVQVQEKTGYQFKFPRLLRSAFTHSSDTNAPVPDLQRLEFLGDAVLDWVSISWLFNTNPNRNPQWLTEHKMAMVSNKFLAALAVTLDFDKFIQTSAIAVISEISKYAAKVRARLSEDGMAPEFWTEIDSPPKVLSDLVESYLGAVLIDSGFDYYEVEKFFNHHVQWFFKDITRYDGFANRHPTSYLYKRFVDKYQCRNFQILSSEPAAGRVETSITAGVVIHGQVLASAVAGSARIAKVKASKIALESVEGMTREGFAAKFNCDCKTRDT